MKLLTAILFSGAIACAQEQTAKPKAASPHVEWVDLHVPVYPPLARQARIEGNVEVQIQFHNCALDREHVQALSGHSLLRGTALDSIHDSAIRCGPFRDASTVLTFEFKIDSCGSDEQRIELDGNTIRVVADTICLNTSVSDRH
ncbi:hypothetical protein [Candidatus Korobacter versatilis]|uniref:hypothetical protein n=1 Tax=Candidatus Korobacter versatilis TaxID=658062 RepID=UPI0002FBE784|nr:hypothetical protein [Candidatus Koribacter versatilis]